MSRIFCVFVNMDKMVGGTFEKGLQKLKGMVEAPPEEPKEKEVPAKPAKPAKKTQSR